VVAAPLAYLMTTGEGSRLPLGGAGCCARSQTSVTVVIVRSKYLSTCSWGSQTPAVVTDTNIHHFNIHPPSKMAALEIFSARAMLIFGAQVHRSQGKRQVSSFAVLAGFRCSHKYTCASVSSWSCLWPENLAIYLGDTKLVFVDVELLSRLQGKTQATWRHRGSSQGGWQRAALPSHDTHARR
jgi:hypothetical protein